MPDLTIDAPPAPREISTALIDATKSAHPDWELLELRDERSGDAYLFRVPGKAEYARFRELSADEAGKPKAVASLTEACSVEKAEYLDLVARQPGLADTFGNKLLSEAGLGVAVAVKKL